MDKAFAILLKAVVETFFAFRRMGISVGFIVNVENLIYHINQRWRMELLAVAEEAGYVATAEDEEEVEEEEWEEEEAEEVVGAEESVVTELL